MKKKLAFIFILVLFLIFLQSLPWSGFDALKDRQGRRELRARVLREPGKLLEKRCVDLAQDLLHITIEIHRPKRIIPVKFHLNHIVLLVLWPYP